MTVNLAAPHEARARTDLPFLRHRTRASRVQASSVQASRVPASGVQPQGVAPAIADFVASRGAHPQHHHPTPAPVRPSPASEPSRPAPSGDLNLSTPTPLPAVESGSTSLDLSSPAPAAPAPAAVPAPAARADSSLELSTGSAPTSVAPPAPAAHLVRPVARARPGERTLLSPKAPTATLNRLQSGIGVLTFEAALSAAVGDLRLGCAYELASGETSIVQPGGGMTSAPRNARNPIIVGRREQFERLTIDLRQTRQLERMVIYGFSESEQQLRWGGTLIVTTFGGTRVELPLDRPASWGVTVFMSVYNIDGEFVIRGEMENINGPVREACKAYGFDRITWLDDRNPVE